jgi:hypothetical protein
MALVEDVTAYFADFGEATTVQGVAAVGIFNKASELQLGDMLTMAPSLELPATVTAAEGGAVVVRGVSYVIRQVVDQPPDGVLRLLVLARA